MLAVAMVHECQGSKHNLWLISFPQSALPSPLPRSVLHSVDQNLLLVPGPSEIQLP